MAGGPICLYLTGEPELYCYPAIDATTLAGKVAAALG